MVKEPVHLQDTNIKNKKTYKKKKTSLHHKARGSRDTTEIA